MMIRTFLFLALIPMVMHAYMRRATVTVTVAVMGRLRRVQNETLPLFNFRYWKQYLFMDGGVSLVWLQKGSIVACIILVACTNKDNSESLSKCCSGIGTCLPSSLIPSENAELLSRGSCNEDELCLPDDFVDLENLIPESCQTLLDAEGRCLPACLPGIVEYSEQLSRESCPKTHLCAPCYDYITGDSTGLCELGGDTGPEDAPVLLEECCNDQGRCVPENWVPEADRSYLDDDGCEGETTFLCVPDPLLEDDYILQSCQSNLNAEGRCVPICLPQIRDEIDDLPKDICPDNFRCAPCFDPKTGDATGVCNMGGDSGPSREPVTFESCCDDQGSCIPESLVQEDQVSHLGIDTCSPNQGLLCVPNDFMDDDFIPKVCHGHLKAEGRCMLECLPEIAEQADLLTKDVCSDGYLCTPCYDPFSGDETGICDLVNDTGPTEDPVQFQTCCNNGGWCIPSEVIPEAQSELVDEETCPTRSDLMCIPDEFLEDGFVLTACRSILGAEGRCAPTCLPDIAEQIDDLPRDICPENYRCAPCYDLRSGDETGICNLGDDPGPSMDPVVFEKCCGQMGSCLPVDMIPEEERDSLGLDTCSSDQGLVCAPDELMEDDFLPTVCHGVLEAEGRCIPECLPAVKESADLLLKDICPDDYLCAPCYDPFTGDDTGVCRLGIDPGPEDGPITFDRCCDQEGWCIPTTVIPDDNVNQLLGEDSCTENKENGDMRCIPDVFLEESFVLTTCRSTLGVEGRCAPVCLPDVAAEADTLSQDICPEYTLCVPCFDLFTGDDTGICTLGGDSGPSTEQVVFDKCCNDLGSCIPEDLVDEGSIDHLGLDTCENNQGLVCMPNEFMEDEFVPLTCHGILEAEGRCVPACLPAVADQTEWLEKDVCPDGHLCAPCYDPFDGTDTGVCTLGSDPGPVETPIIFDTCCGELGTCVPEQWVPEDQQAQLNADGCNLEQNLKCAPSFLVEAAVPETCQSILYAEGRCLPTCLPDVAEQADMLPQDICPSNHLCAPCYDLYTGLSTGACSFPEDKGPTRPPVLFDKCCSGEGTCLPQELISEDQQALLGEDTCNATSDVLCVPTVLQDDEFTPTVCASIADSEGRCLPECLPAVESQKSFLPVDSCDTGFRCAPCYDPFSGEDTGACTLPNDTGPTKTPVIFDKCCESNSTQTGTCMPKDSIPSELTDQLIVDSCTSADHLCVPNNIIQSSDPTGFPGCIGASDEEGACVPGCYLSWEEQLVFSRTTCGQGEYCVDCYILGISTGVCQ